MIARSVTASPSKITDTGRAALNLKRYEHDITLRFAEITSLSADTG
jgi:hypothetical protein